MSSKPEPAIWSRDTGQRISWYDSCQLHIICMSNINDICCNPRLHDLILADGISRRPSSSPRVCTDGVRSVGRTLTSEPNFLCLMGYHFSLPMVLRWRASRAEAPLLLLLIMFLGLRKLETFIADAKCFWKKSETFFLSATNVAHGGKRGNICVGNNVASFRQGLTLVKRLMIVDDSRW